MFAIIKMVIRPMYKRIMYLKRKKRKFINPHYILQNINTPLIKKSYANSPPKYMTTLIPKQLPLSVMNDKGQVTEKQSSPHHWKS